MKVSIEVKGDRTMRVERESDDIEIEQGVTDDLYSTLRELAMYYDEYPCKYILILLPKDE